MEWSPALSLSPRFNAHSSSIRLAGMAARVVKEFKAKADSEDIQGFFLCENEEKFVQEQIDQHEEEEEEEEENVNNSNEAPRVEEAEKKVNSNQEDDYEEDEDFEFALVKETPTVSADEIFYNGQIRPIFPLFDGDLSSGNVRMTRNFEASKPSTPSSIRLPLRKLLIEDRDLSSCSSLEEDELDGIPLGTYCVWTPSGSADRKCKKSNSTGSSKRWKFRDLLHRSNSDGKDTFVFLASSSASSKKKVAEKRIGGGEGVAVTANRTKTRGMNSNEHRGRSYLPYRKDLVHFFTNVNGLSRNLHPF